MARGPRKRRRPAKAAAPKATAVAVAPVAREWCETHQVAYVAGDVTHEGCIHFALTRERTTEKANHSVYFDEAATQERRRVPTRVEGIDRVLGGGWVEDAVYLLSGETGAGKSTLLMQVCQWWLLLGRRVLYVSGEENASQVGERAARLGVTWHGRVLHTKDLGEVRAEIDRLHGTDDDPDLIICDSAQAIADKSGLVSGGVGSVSQSLHVAHTLAEIAKRDGRCVVLVGQETKEGEAAGSQQMPHLVDAILELHKNDRGERYLYGKKNRFGTGGELVVLDMTPTGLVEIGNVTEELLARRLGDVGIVPFAAADRARPILVAVKASAELVDEDVKTLNVESDGYDTKRLRNVLLWLQKALGGGVLFGRAIRVQVPQILGEDVKDKELDLAVAAALLSALTNRPPPKALVFGEVGIDGHVEGDKRASMRLVAGRDHKTLKLTAAMIPPWTNAPSGVAVTRIGHLRDLEHALWGTRTGMARPPKAEKPDSAG